MLGKEKVMVIDDDVLLLKMAAELLDEDYTVSLARSGTLALAILQKGFLPDIILLDISMPVMDGYQTLKRVKALEGLEQIPVIFLTGMIDSDEEIKGLEAGAVDYIRKPFVKEVLLTRIHVHLANARLLREKNTLDEDKLGMLDETLTEAELKVARLLAQAYTNEEIGRTLNYSVAYVKKIVSRILKKLDIKSRSEIKRFLK